MTRLLEGLGYAVRTASNMADALHAASDHDFDLVISDIGLPDGSGLDLMRQLRQHSQVPGIALTGFDLDVDLASSREAGFVEHLTKPVDFHKLEEIIRNVAGKA
jgi:CheY-like chemotaxis protein